METSTLPRYFVSTWHGEIGTIFAVIDRKTDRHVGMTSTMRDGGAARELADIQANALNKAA